MINHASTSSINPVIWREVMSYLHAYWQRSPYESRVFNPNFSFISNQKIYKTVFTIQRKLPVLAAQHLVNIIPGTNKMRENLSQLKDAFDKCEEIGNSFEHFTVSEWIFDNKQAMRLYLQELSEAERRTFNIDVTVINWRMYLMNFAYGIKRFILKEEAELPSVGYNDVISLMNQNRFVNFIPFYTLGKWINVRSPEEMKKIVLASDEVRDAMAQVVRERTTKYR